MASRMLKATDLWTRHTKKGLAQAGRRKNQENPLKIHKPVRNLATGGITV